MVLSLGTLEIKEKNHAYVEMVSVITMRQKAFTDSIMNTFIVVKVVASVMMSAMPEKMHRGSQNY